MINSYIRTMKKVNSLVRGICDMSVVQNNTDLNEYKCYKMIIESGVVEAIESINRCDAGKIFDEITEVIANRIVIMLSEHARGFSKSINIDTIFFKGILEVTKEAVALD